MSNELKKSICLEEINKNIYHANPSLLTSGRYIKTLRHLHSQLDDENEKIECEYLINKCLQKHIVYLQEGIINGLGKENTTNIIPKEMVDKIKLLSKSDYSINDQRYSLVDVETFKNIKILKKAVLLKKDLVLPFKVKSENQQYKFNTEIIVTKNNVLTYCNDLEYDACNNRVYHYSLINKIGKGIKKSELLNKNKVHTK